MGNILKADGYRVLRRKSTRITLGVLYAVFLGLILYVFTSVIRSGVGETAFAENYSLMIEGFMPLISQLAYGLMIYTAIIQDDVGNKIFPTQLSTGHTRTQFVLAKYISYAFWLLVTFLVGFIFYLATLGLGSLFMGGQWFNPTLLSSMTILGFTSYLSMLAFGALSMILTYYFQNTTIVNMLLPLAILGLIQGIIETLGLLPYLGNLFTTFSNYTITTAFSNISMNVSGLANTSYDWSIITESWLVMGVYIIIGVIITVFVFRNREVK